mmetsp:Transcript_44205/g.102086  ORF Transcript_44205/g.102086 Transcript_44205/m.102086 type:complete len:793 (-) Transcript_44205:76-2454(-)
MEETLASGEKAPLLTAHGSSSYGAEEENASSAYSIDAQYAAEEAEELNELEKSGIFPMDCAPNLFFIPSQLRVFQDGTHLALVLFLASAVIYVAGPLIAWDLTGSRWSNQSAACWSKDGVWQDTPCHCGYRVANLVVYSAILVYFLTVIRQYDANLCHKKRELRAKSGEVQKLFEDMMGDLDATLRNSADSNAGLAERTLASRKKDFTRFMERFRTLSKEQPDKVKDVKLEFTRFVQSWLAILSECSLDPLRQPLMLMHKDAPLNVEDEELAAHTTVADMASLVAECLKSTEVNIWNTGVEKDKKQLHKLEESFRNTATLQEASIRRRHTLLHEHDDLETSLRKLRDSESDGQRSWCSYCWHARKVIMSKRGKHRWVHFHRFGGTKPLQWGVAGSLSRMPMTFKCGCVHIIVLGGKHAGMCLAVICLLLFTIVEIWFYGNEKQSNVQFSLLVALNILMLLSVCVVLHNIVNIDEVLNLGRQLQELQEQQDAFDAKRRRIVQFYKKAERQSDVWLHRTIPRLDIMKEMHEAIEESNDMLAMLKEVNSAMDLLDNSLPPLCTWCDPCPDIHVTIIGAKSLRNADSSTFLRMVGRDKSDPYCVVELQDGTGHSVHKTRVISDDLDPTWDETCHFHNYNTPDPIKFVVRDKDFGGADDPLGNCTLPGSSFYEEGKWEMGFEGRLPLTGEGAQDGSALVLRVEVTLQKPKAASAAKAREDRYTVPPAERQQIGKAMNALVKGDFDHRSIIKDMPSVARKVAEVRDKLEEGVPKEAGERSSGAASGLPDLNSWFSEEP